MKVRDVGLEYWGNFMSESDSATFFHSPGWYQLWAKWSGGKPRAFVFKSGQNNLGLLPVLITSSRFGMKKTLTSSPMGTHGGIVWRSMESLFAGQEVKRFCNSFQKIHISSYPDSGQLFEKHLSAEEDTTLFISLRDSYSKILDNFSENHQRSIKKAQRNGLVIKSAKTNDDWNEYYSMYKMSIARWGSKARFIYNNQFFHLIRQLPQNNYNLWLACKNDGKPIYGCLCFYFNNHVVYWHGSGDSEYFNLGSPTFLHSKIILDAQKKGYLVYDLNPSGGLSGVEDFKRGFGPVEGKIQKLIK